MQKLTRILIASLALALLVGVSASSTNAAEANATRFVVDNEMELNLDLPFEEIGQLLRVDLGNDGVDELVISSGFNEAPTIAILRLDGSRIDEFIAFAPDYKRGITITVGDYDGDGEMSIVASTMQGGGPHVRVFNVFGELEDQFFAYNQAFTGGVNLATADIDGDGIDEIVTAAGLGGGPHVRVVRPSGMLVAEFFAYDASDNAGVSVTRIDENENGKDELVVAHYGLGNPEASVVRFDVFNMASISAPFSLYENYNYGVSLFPIDDTTFGVSPNGNENQDIKMFNANGTLVLNRATFEQEYTGRVHVAAKNVDSIIATKARPVLFERLDKHILVNLDEQRLYALDNGVIQKTFLISAAKWPFKTPTGEFDVMRKLRMHDYRWFYGENDSRNYELNDVEYNLEFTRHYYIHYAYWHNNWGHPMSHGCVNAPYEGVEWLYNWSEVGTPVVVI